MKTSELITHLQWMLDKCGDYQVSVEAVGLSSSLNIHKIYSDEIGSLKILTLSPEDSAAIDKLHAEMAPTCS